MSRLFTPLIQLFDASGATAGAGTITFFAQGTLTLQNTFQNAARTLANENPVTVDGSGLSPAIYLQYKDYTILAEDSDGTTLWEKDFDGRWLADGSDYTQGGTGSSARTVQSRLAERISVADFGPAGNNSTNDAVKIQAAIDAANTAGSELYFPAPSSKYFIGTTSLKFYDGSVFRGDGMANTIFRYTGSGNAFESNDRSSTRIFRGVFENFKIEGSSKTSGSNGINCRRVDRFAFVNLWVTDFDIGLVFDGTGSGGYRNDIMRGNYEGNNTGIQIINAANEQRINNAKIDLNTNYGVDVQGGNSISIIDANMESNGIHVRTADQNTRVIRGRMESATVRPWETTSAAEFFEIEGTYLNSTNTAVPLDSGKFSRIHTRESFSKGTNLVVNGSMEAWSSGITSAPDRWTLSNATVARDTDEQAGTYSALLTATATSGQMFHDVPLPLLWADGRREFLVKARLKLGTSAKAALVAIPQDSGGATQGTTFLETTGTASGSRIETEASGWHTLILVVRPNSSAVRIRVGYEADRTDGANTCFCDAMNVSPLMAGREEYLENSGDLAPLVKNILVATATIDFDATDAGTSTVTVPNAAVGDPVLITPPNDTAAASYHGRVSSANTVTVTKIGTGDPASGSFVITVFNLR